MRDKQAHAPAIKEWISRALTDFKARMPDGVDWSAAMHLDEGFVHFHIIAINTKDPKLDANKLHAGKAAAAKLREDLDRIEQTAKRADEDAGTALDAKERYLRKEAELDAGIQAMDILVNQMAAGDAEITEDGVAMANTPPFFKRLFGHKPPQSKESQLFRKIVALLGRMDARQHTAPDQGHSPEP